jgi:hypothetical protein
MSSEHAAEIAAIEKKIDTALTNSAGHAASIVAARKEVIGLMAAYNCAADAARPALVPAIKAAKVRLVALESAKAPDGEGSVYVNALRQKIADLRGYDAANAEAEARKDGYYVAPGVDTGQAAARAARQAAEGARAADAAATQARLDAEIAAAAVIP